MRMTAIFGSVSIMITPLQATALVKDEESGTKHRRGPETVGLEHAFLIDLDPDAFLRHDQVFPRYHKCL